MCIDSKHLSVITHVYYLKYFLIVVNCILYDKTVFIPISLGVIIEGQFQQRRSPYTSDFYAIYVDHKFWTIIFGYLQRTNKKGSKKDPKCNAISVDSEYRPAAAASPRVCNIKKLTFSTHVCYITIDS